ncbi:polyprenyl synthetase family protein [Lacticaseibacillus saniviri]|uniref:Geranylgeranyl pyrophosphate synthase n=1 Tax=Lacticaseibacillus saniviri JCM 17471 = DSM 24301 TaxID=1293598 RepID=A0A0R2MTW3_9LACO|nr:polyprenyl synthetase family protein [Lacticaseibacillus saniviri]KRO16935.1 geranylgeranyl pyrophosphate synthase [Lacticaseibacillus saniviri JCM 17471 = DSM 24301]MCG4281603.1 polyprenyl synthetase family protein [Lacticaseibacillus saniviri]
MIYSLWHRYPDIYPQLEHVQARLTQKSRIRNPAVTEVVTAQINASGKMLRSGLMFMFARFGDPTQPGLISAGAAIEALHLATLVHDDVLDHADTRRGVSTVQATSGNRAAIYAGDFLFSVYFELLSQASPDVSNIGTNAMAMRRIFLGELDQNWTQNNAGITQHQYLRQISGKTAALFALATYQGVRVSQADTKLYWPAYRFGRYLGMAFQMIDDLLDYTGDPSTTQKPVFEDLKNGVYTLPLIMAIERQPALQEQLKQPNWSDDQFNAIVAAVQQYGIQPATELAQKYTDKALATLQQFSDSQARDELLALTTMLLKRDK